MKIRLIKIIPLCMAIGIVSASMSCTKDRIFLSNENPKQDTILPRPSTLFINEIYYNAVSTEPDWVELYNASDTEMILPSTRIYFTDDPLLAEKFRLDCDQLIPPHGYSIVTCDKNPSCDPQIGTNFSLSSSGEFFGVYIATGSLSVVDSLHFPADPVAGNSYGRVSDGSSQWKFFDSPSMNNPN